MHPKGISNFLSATILVLIVMAVSVLVLQWMNTMTTDQATKIRNTTLDQLGCQYADMYIKNATYNCTGGCAAGAVHNLTAVVRNNGKRSIEIDKMAVRNTTGSTFVFGVTPIEIAPGEEQMIVNGSNMTCSGINNTADALIISSLNCPQEAHDSLPGSLIKFLGC